MVGTDVALPQLEGAIPGSEVFTQDNLVNMLKT